VVEAILEVNQRQGDLKGYEMVEPPRFLRHLTARFRRAAEW
jgi:tryptophanase